VTPSAARGILEAIFWKPEFHWQVRQIAVLRPIRFFSILRNEVNSKASAGAPGPYFADEDRAQRHTLALREVAYVVRAEVVLKPEAASEHPAKYRDQFRRRVARGQCHYSPYLGCREFAASFGLPSPEDEPLEELNDDLGLMLFDLDYAANGSAATPRFFHARLEHGVLHVPPGLYAGKEGTNASPAG
jgi:CRISPR-associated protein Cas5d